MPLAAVTIDLDSARHYHAIHGVPPPEGADPVVVPGLKRFLDVCRRLEVRATLFCVAMDLDDKAVAVLVGQAAAEGHEIANHSLAHDYRLSRLTPAAIHADLVAARAAIEKVAGHAPVGFRAPGYNLSHALLQAVVDTGHVYDSSIFPSWPYFAARAAAIASYAVQGSPSRSLVGDVREFTAPRAPFRPSARSYVRPATENERALGLWEIPIAVAPAALPMIGTFLSLYPPLMRRMLCAWRTRVGGPFNLEMHAIDFVDAADGVHPAVVQRQKDLSMPLAQRMQAFEDVVGEMRARMDVRPLREWLPMLPLSL